MSLKDPTLAVWKYDVHPGTTEIRTPARRVLKVGVQDDAVVMWVEVVPDTPMRPLRVKTLMTGEKYKTSDLEGLRYLDTVQVGDVVVHVWVGP